MTALELIDRRLRIWDARLARAEGKYHTKSTKFDEKQRIAAMHECRLCQQMVLELQSIREEIAHEGA